MRRPLITYFFSALTLMLSAGIVADAVAAPRKQPFRVALIGDPQVNDSAEMSYARKSVYKELSERKDIDFALFLGDLVNDNMQLLPESVRIIDSLPYPCMMIPGNHDRDVYKTGTDRQASRARDLSTWKKTVGYVDTAFYIGNIRFILMNNVRARSGGMSDYEGGFTERQRHWLDSVFNRTPEMPTGSNRTNGSKSTSLTILATHIPFSQMKGQDSIIAMIPDACKLIFVSGHTHSVARSEINGARPDGVTFNAEEVIAGATCGSWWRGVKDEDGIPYALQNCGAPRGYFVADVFDDGRYRLDYKCVGKPERKRLSVWLVKEEMAPEGYSKRSEDTDDGVNDVSSTSSDVKSENEQHFRLFTNIYGGCVNGSVDIELPRKFGKQFKSLCNSAVADVHHLADSTCRKAPYRRLPCFVCNKTAPEVMEIIDLNASTSRAYRKAHRDEFIPLRRKPSPHLWKSETLCLSPDKLQRKSEVVSISPNSLQGATGESIAGHRKVAFYVTVRYLDPQMKIRQRHVPVFIY